MPEAITKYAVNSTLGTDEFQPLDQMIVGQKMFVASDTPIAVGKNIKKVTEDYVVFAKFAPRIGGTLKVSFFLDSSGYQNVTGYFRIQEDGITVFSVDDDESNDFEITINISAKKTYEFSCAASPSDSVTVKNFKISGDIVDSNWFEFENYEI